MGIGFRELMIILVIALLVFGTKRLRSIGSDLGGAVRGFKKALHEGEDASGRPPAVSGADAEFPEARSGQGKGGTSA